MAAKKGAAARAAESNRRDASKIFDISSTALKTIKEEATDDPLLTAVNALKEIKPIAKRMDARTGKSDPSTRKKK